MCFQEVTQAGMISHCLFDSRLLELFLLRVYMRTKGAAVLAAAQIQQMAEFVLHKPLTLYLWIYLMWRLSYLLLQVEIENQWFSKEHLISYM